MAPAPVRARNHRRLRHARVPNQRRLEREAQVRRFREVARVLAGQ